MNDKKLYQITLAGYDDDTVFNILLTDVEVDLIVKVSLMSILSSGCDSMPRMYIKELNNESNDKN